jgi:hypothetical protein
MFEGRTNLTVATVLPATTMTTRCYYDMFKDCTSLTTAPEINATTLALKCYYRMFKGCTLLNNIKCLATDISATDCTKNWLLDVSQSGTFTKAASMTSWISGVDGIPTNWTVVDATQ